MIKCIGSAAICAALLLCTSAKIIIAQPNNRARLNIYERYLREAALGKTIRGCFERSDRACGANRVQHDVLAEGCSQDLHSFEPLLRAYAFNAWPIRLLLLNGSSLFGLPSERI